MRLKPRVKDQRCESVFDEVTDFFVVYLEEPPSDPLVPHMFPKCVFKLGENHMTT